ncbi:LysR family transcriptional regulator [Nonomuraea sp. NPDC050404]|uniref:LysR family transcriptional regulator n=1 Tax=Nonomuraea sp. NPDC050404 TaxID=3155783 RepID=UPI0033C51D14
MEIAVGQVEALLALDEHSSFTRAAQALGVTQSGVSRAIAALERHLGAPVVHRHPGGASLTALGREVATHGRAAVEHLRAIEALAERVRPDRLRVGAVASALVRLVPEALAKLGPERPALVLQGEDEELPVWLSAGTIDLAITTTPPDAATAPQPDAHPAVGKNRATPPAATPPAATRSPAARPAGENDHPAGGEDRAADGQDPTVGGGETQGEFADEFLAVLPRRHPLARHDRVALADLMAAGVADPGGTCGPLLAAGFAAHGVEWRPAHVVRDVATVLAMAEAEITAGVVPSIAAPRPTPPNVVLLPLDPPLHRTIYVRHHPGNPQAALLAKLLVKR